MYPRIKNTAHKVVYAFQCSRRRPGARGEALLPRPGGRSGRLGRPSGTVWGPLPPPAWWTGQHQLLGPPGQRRTPGQPSLEWASTPDPPGAAARVARAAVGLPPSQALQLSRPSSGRSARAMGGCQVASRQRAPPWPWAAPTSLRITHTGESVWMERRSASRGPKAGSTSPSATPL